MDNVHHFFIVRCKFLTIVHFQQSVLQASRYNFMQYIFNPWQKFNSNFIIFFVVTFEIYQFVINGIFIGIPCTYYWEGLTTTLWLFFLLFLFAKFTASTLLFNDMLMGKFYIRLEDLIQKQIDVLIKLTIKYFYLFFLGFP